jgi:hypothetical protein
LMQLLKLDVLDLVLAKTLLADQDRHVLLLLRGIFLR